VSAPVVLHVTTSAISLDLLLGRQLRAIADAGYRVVTASAPGPEVDRVRSWGIEHVALPHSTRSFDPRSDAVAALELYRTIRRVRPDIVHTHNPKTGVYGRMVAAAARVPSVVNTVHGLYAQPTDRWRRRAPVYALERLASVFSDHEFVVSEEDVETLRSLRVPLSKMTRLPSGVELHRFDPARVPPEDVARLRADLGLDADDVAILVVGRLVWEKGYGEVFEAARLGASHRPRVRWIVVGPADPGKRDRVDAASLRRAERDGVRVVGARGDMPVVYAAAQVMVLASYREGLPLSAMEAAAMGLPVVATDIRGCRQVVADGVTGLLVPPRRAPELAAAVQRLAADPELRRSLGHAARARAVREFDEDRAIGHILSVYAGLLARSARRA
jgi:glycosyltransferase involved in cell wall biosynthesis